MITPTVAGQEEAQLYEELQRAIEDVEEGEQRQIVLNRMIKQLRFAKWRKDRMRKVDAYCQRIKPASLWIILATGALAPVLLFSMFIWVSLWVE
ncbi:MULTISPECIES: hypothetical protein [Paenibacillus]|uniref:hypothetical protein n=1 Tax=Paenibacillus TaxID=44249 RepID=UPI00201DF2AC|nr:MULTISPECIES: hypothetical protein [Paenibacillus]MCL6660624.1 hypothetical protein [Paenibacillus amylolyticus]WJM09289.1 hypothetical protein QNO02_04915 [Paenibacillus sp. PK1-4R]